MATVLITGANGGLGSFLARKLCERGNTVILGYNKSNNNLLNLKKEYASHVIILNIDVTSEVSIKNAHFYLKNMGIKIDTLINNAGIDITSDLEAKSVESFLKIYKVNAIGVFLMIREFLPELQEAHGHIVNISSDNTVDAYDMVSLEYDISKCGVNQITKTFARSYQDIYINALLFGWLDTPMNDFPSDIKKQLNFISLNKATDKIIEYMHTKKSGELELVRK